MEISEKVKSWGRGVECRIWEIGKPKEEMKTKKKKRKEKKRREEEKVTKKDCRSQAEHLKENERQRIETGDPGKQTSAFVCSEELDTEERRETGP